MKASARSLSRARGPVRTYFSFAFARRFFATAGGALIGSLAFLSSSSSGGPALEIEEAQAGPPDAGSTLPFVAHAQQGRVVPPDLDDVELMCSLLMSCPGLPIPPNYIPGDFKECVKKLGDEMTSPAAVGFSLTLRECGLKANSCDALRSCALRGADPLACDGRGTGKEPVGFCDADGRALTCWHGKILAVRNCPFGGEQCSVRQGEAHCILGPCPANIKSGDAAQCSASGTRILKCEGGKLTSLDCAAFGLKCVSENGGAAGCATSGGACTGNARRCEGKIAVGCHNGHEVRVDCGAAGLVCDANAAAGSTIGACVAPKPDAPCNPNDPPKCDGASIKYCAHGRPRTYLCKPRFNKCEKDARGVHCAP